MAKCKIFDIECPYFDNPEEDCWYNEEYRCDATKGLKYVKKPTVAAESKKKQGLLQWFRKRISYWKKSIGRKKNGKK